MQRYLISSNKQEVSEKFIIPQEHIPITIIMIPEDLRCLQPTPLEIEK